MHPTNDLSRPKEHGLSRIWEQSAKLGWDSFDLVFVWWLRRVERDYTMLFKTLQAEGGQKVGQTRCMA